MGKDIVEYHLKNQNHDQTIETMEGPSRVSPGLVIARAIELAESRHEVIWVYLGDHQLYLAFTDGTVRQHPAVASLRRRDLSSS